MNLFLDFDDVLHRESCYRDEDLFCRRALFESVMRDFLRIPAVLTVCAGSGNSSRCRNRAFAIAL